METLGMFLAGFVFGAVICVVGFKIAAKEAPAKVARFLRIHN